MSTTLDSSTGAAPALPEIAVPSDWYEWFLAGGEKPSEPTTLVDERCDVCGWNGQDKTLFGHHYYQFETEDLEGRECVSCQFLLHARREISKHISNDDKPDERDASRYHCWNTPTENTIFLRHPKQSTFPLEMDEGRVSSFFFILSEDGNKSSNPWGLPTRKTVASDFLSEESATWAKERLHECSSNHPDCASASPKTGFLPTRLIAVEPLGQDGDVKLIQIASLTVREVQYAAVSYVWGDSKLQANSKTTADNLAQHVGRIVWSKIPKTLQDAITFTRNIGLDYIWIDSFCIIQNDPDEWGREAGRMFDVYKQSYVLLAALWGADCSKGLCSSPDTYWSKQIATLRLEQHTWPLHVSREHEVLDLKYFWQSQRPPLFKRAWCFQERSISPRCLFFGRNELIYGCYQQVTCQCGIEYQDVDSPGESNTASENKNNNGGEEAADPHSYSKGNPQAKSEGTKKPPHNIRWVEEDPEQAWVEILEEYTRLQLTNGNERLIAVGGVAKQLSFSRLGEQYLAGLWSGSFLKDLLWRVPRYHYGKENPDIPSWSWAHHGNPVQYGRFGDIATTAEVVEVTCSYHNDDPFGILKDSKLILRGRLMHWWPSASKLLGRIPWVRSHRAFSWDNNLIFQYSGLNVISDDSYWKRVPEDCYLFEVGHAKENNSVRFFLLLKSEDSQLKTFSRIGILQDWLFFETEGHEVSPDLKALNYVFSKKSKVALISLI